MQKTRLAKSKSTEHKTWAWHMVTNTCMNNQWTISFEKKKKGPRCCAKLYPLYRTCFDQYQVSSTVLGWPGDGDCYLVHKMQSGRKSSNIVSLCATTLWRLLLWYKRSQSSHVVDAQTHMYTWSDYPIRPCAQIGGFSTSLCGVMSCTLRAHAINVNGCTPHMWSSL